MSSSVRRFFHQLVENGQRAGALSIIASTQLFELQTAIDSPTVRILSWGRVEYVSGTSLAVIVFPS